MFRQEQQDRELRKMGDDDAIDSKQQELIQKYDKRLLSWLYKMHKMLGKDEIPVDDLDNALKVLDHMKNENENKYMQDLVYPESATNAKIPTRFPVPSSSFQLHSSFMLTTNSSGNLAGYINPFYIGNGTGSTCYINNSPTLAGNGSDDNFELINAGQNVPANVYDRYRLVSCSMQITYVGRWDYVSGIIGGGITFDTTIAGPGDFGPGTTVTNNAGARYGNFDLVDDSYFSHRTQTINGLRIIFVPVGPQQEEYQVINEPLAGENFHFYCQGLPAEVQCLRVDLYSNFECLADPAFQNYIPATSCTGRKSDVQRAAKMVSENKDMAVTSVKEYKEKKPSVWNKLFKKGLGFVKNLALDAIPDLVPGVGAIKKFLPMGELLSSITTTGGENVDMVD